MFDWVLIRSPVGFVKTNWFQRFTGNKHSAFFDVNGTCTGNRC